MLHSFISLSKKLEFSQLLYYLYIIFQIHTEHVKEQPWIPFQHFKTLFLRITKPNFKTFPQQVIQYNQLWPRATADSIDRSSNKSDQGKRITHTVISHKNSPKWFLTITHHPCAVDRPVTQLPVNTGTQQNIVLACSLFLSQWKTEREWVTELVVTCANARSTFHQWMGKCGKRTSSGALPPSGGVYNFVLRQWCVCYCSRLEKHINTGCLGRQCFRDNSETAWWYVELGFTP